MVWKDAGGRFWIELSIPSLLDISGQVISVRCVHDYFIICGPSNLCIWTHAYKICL